MSVVCGYLAHIYEYSKCLKQPQGRLRCVLHSKPHGRTSIEDQSKQGNTKLHEFQPCSRCKVTGGENCLYEASSLNTPALRHGGCIREVEGIAAGPTTSGIPYLRALYAWKLPQVQNHVLTSSHVYLQAHKLCWNGFA